MGELASPTSEDAQLDGAVIAKLPPNCKVLSVTSLDVSKWVTTVKILVELPSGQTSQFFKKSAPGSVAANMMKGTFEAEQALHAFVPDRVPRPVAWGPYVSNPDIHFYLCEFVDMENDVPIPEHWAVAVSELHLNSMGKSPTGQFGFHVPTHLANVPVNNTWNSSWAVFWAQQMKGLFYEEAQVHEPDEELEALKTAFLERAIPRYLGPLQSEGRSIEPCLVHSDLWPGNIKPRTLTKELCIFDACAYWGHNEADLGVCRNPRYKLGPPCIHEYTKRVDISQPVEDFDGRNAVYAMKYHVLLSVMYNKDKSFRQTFIGELRSLLEKMGLISVPASPPTAKTIQHGY